MKGRFGRNIYCQKCGGDDKIRIEWLDKFSYKYVCDRCEVKVKESDQSDRLAKLNHQAPDLSGRGRMKGRHFGTETEEFLIEQ